MKKLALIGTVIVAVAVPLVVAQGAGAKPTGMSPAQYHALLFRQSQQQLNLERGKDERFAAGNPLRSQGGSSVPPGMTRAEYQALILRSEGMNQKYGVDNLNTLTLERPLNDRFTAGNPTKLSLLGSTPTPTESSPEFQWGDAGIGAGALLGLVAILGITLVGFRHHGHQGNLGTS